MRGELVDEVGAPQGVKVSEDAGVEMLVVHVHVAVESIGPYDGRGSNLARAYVDIVCVDEFPEFSKFVHHSRRPKREVTEYGHHCLIVFVHEYFSSAHERYERKDYESYGLELLPCSDVLP
jgi:hypothetical protein